MKRPEIPYRVITEIAEIVKVEKPAQFGLVLREWVREAFEQSSGFEKTAGGKITGRKSDAKTAEAISRLAAELSRELKKASPYLRTLLSPRRLPGLGSIGGPSLGEWQHVVATLKTNSGAAYNTISRGTGKRQRQVRDELFRDLRKGIEECGQLNYLRIARVPQLLLPYLPKEIGNVQERTVWRAIKNSDKNDKKRPAN